MIVILADDLGYADVEFHSVVTPDVSTPHLNRLAGRGAVFRNGYSASPVCSNSRLALITGRYPQRWGAYYYGEGGLPTAERTLAEMMREAGYRTMKVGKTHLNNGAKEEPVKHGFDHSLSFRHHSWDYHMLSEKDVAAYNQKKPGSARQANSAPFGPLIRDGVTPVSFENTTTTEVFGRESIDFIKKESTQPFYLQLEFNAVHTPLVRAPETLRKKYGIPARPFDRNAAVWEFPLWDPLVQPNFKQWYGDTCHLGVADPYGRKIYLAHLELMDQVIGQIMSTLEEQGILQNTIVFFSSDNGGSNQSYANNGDINAYKYCLMNGGIKVPMILSWPDRIEGGMSIDDVVTHRDLFPTLAEVIGEPSNHELDGKSLMPLLTQGKRAEEPERAEEPARQLHEEVLFWDCGNKNQTWIAMQGDWKLVYRKDPRDYLVYELDDQGLVKSEFRRVPIAAGLQLYHLGEDAGERTNLAERYPQRVAEMKQARDRWRETMQEPVSGKKAR